MAESKLSLNRLNIENRTINASSFTEGVKTLYANLRNKYGNALICEIGFLVVPGSDMGAYIAVNRNSYMQIFAFVRNYTYVTQDGNTIFRFQGSAT